MYVLKAANVPKGTTTQLVCELLHNVETGFNHFDMQGNRVLEPEPNNVFKIGNRVYTVYPERMIIYDYSGDAKDWYEPTALTKDVSTPYLYDNIFSHTKKHLVGTSGPLVSVAIFNLRALEYKDFHVQSGVFVDTYDIVDDTRSFIPIGTKLKFHGVSNILETKNELFFAPGCTIPLIYALYEKSHKLRLFNFNETVPYIDYSTLTHKSDTCSVCNVKLFDRIYTTEKTLICPICVHNTYNTLYGLSTTMHPRTVEMRIHELDLEYIEAPGLISMIANERGSFIRVRDHTYVVYSAYVLACCTNDYIAFGMYKQPNMRGKKVIQVKFVL